MKTIPVVNILNFVLNRSLKSIYRKLSFRQKYRNPWTIVLSEPIAREFFYELFTSINNHLPDFGFHVGKIIGEDKINLVKGNKTTKEKVKVVCTDENLIKLIVILAKKF